MTVGKSGQGIKPLRWELALALAKGHTCRQELCAFAILALLVCGSSGRLESKLLESISLIPKDGTRLLGRSFLFSGFAVILFSASLSPLCASLQNLSTASWKAYVSKSPMCVCIEDSCMYVLEDSKSHSKQEALLLQVSHLCFLSFLLFFFKEMVALQLICTEVTLKI